MISGIIMASGYSKRFNDNKLLFKIDGKPLIERVIGAAAASKLQEIIIIYRCNQVKQIADKYPIKAIYNELAHEGQSAAVKLGIKNASPNTKGYLFMVGDQPFLSSEIINSIIDIYNKSQAPIVIPTYCGKQGNPVLFSSKLKDRLTQVNGDKGGRIIFKEYHKEISFDSFSQEEAGIDIDTEKDLSKLKIKS
ncbi:nucleotidyltransferase family protein [Alkaliphilus pronyensis]|nr:nucleotidyltransferase family protein [Alkaliphilus pronyensis]